MLRWLFLVVVMLVCWPSSAWANFAQGSSVFTQGAELSPQEEHPSVSIQRELIHLAIGGAGVEPVARWSIAYELHNDADEPVVIDGVFPVEILLHPDTMRWPPRARAALRAVGELVVDVGRGDAELEAWLDSQEADAPFLFGTPLGRLVLDEPIQARVEASRATALGLAGFRADQDGEPILPGGPLVTLRTVELEALQAPGLPPVSRRAGLPDDPRPEDLLLVRAEEGKGSMPTVAFHLTLELPLQVSIPAGASSDLLVQYEVTVPFDGTLGLQDFATSYLLGSGHGWKGPIRELTVMIDRMALQARRAPRLPFEARPYPWGDAVAWTVQDYEPAPEHRIVLGGEAVELTCWRDTPAYKEKLAKELAKYGEVYECRGWEVPMAPSLPALPVRGSSVLAGRNLFPHCYGEIATAMDLGFGPGNAVDGETRTAWCAEPGDPAPTLDFELAHEALRLIVHVGDHSQHAWVDCEGARDPGCSLVRGEDGWEPVGRFVAAPTVCAERFPRPERVVLTGPGPEASRVGLVNDHGSVVLVGPFPAGAYQLVMPPADSGSRCVSELKVFDMIPEDRRRSIILLSLMFGLERPAYEP